MIFPKNIKSIIGTFCLFLLMSSCGGESATTPKATTPEAKKATQGMAAKTSNPTAKVIIGGKDMTVKSGEEFCMDVKASNFVDIIAMQYSTNWDDKILEYKGVKSFTLKDMSSESFGKPKNEPNSLRTLWMSMDLKPVSLFNDASIYQICFKAKGKSGTTAQISFTDKPIVSEVVNSKSKKVPAELKPATITIE